MNSPRILPHVASACIALAIPLVLVACGGGGSGGEPAGPVEPPIVQPPPVVRGLTNFQSASAVLGQPSPDVAQLNQGHGPSAQTLAFPVGLAVMPDGGLLVADAGNHRVLFFQSVPTSNGAGAVRVLGQGDNFAGSAPDLTQDSFTAPLGVTVGAGKMAVVDRDNHRVLIYTELPTPGSTPSPVAVIGQGGFDSSDTGCSDTLLNSPNAAVITPDNKLIVADTMNHRVLVWDQVPTAIPAPIPTLVIGQSDAFHCAPNDDDQDHAEDRNGMGNTASTARTLFLPTDVWSDGNKVVVADTYNSRVLIWNSFPLDDFAEAEIVLGHSTFTNSIPNSEDEAVGGLPNPSPRTLFGPEGIHSDGTTLAVADTSNNRVLVWNTFPKDNMQAANIVIGHADFSRFVTGDLNGDEAPDAPSSQVLYNPRRVLLTPDALLVTDTRHHRVLVFRR